MENSSFHCVVCTKPIALDRAVKKAVTCSEDCAKIYRNSRRQLLSKARSKCRMCNRPGTPEEWASFRAWRKTLPKQKPGRKKQAAQPDPLQAVMPNQPTIH